MSHTTAQPNFVSHVCQDTFGNYTAHSAFKKNLDTFFSTISSDTSIDYGFYNFSVGQNLDIVNGIGLCMPDVASADCRSCLDEGAQAIVQQCPTQKDAIGWYEKCMIRYSDRYIFGKKEFRPRYILTGLILDPVDKVKYNQTVSTLLAKLQAKAASGDSRRKFGAGEANVTGSITIYALVQCTPDLKSFDCYDCVDNAISTALTSQYGKYARLLYTSCNIRYENYPFYDSKSLMSLDQPSVPPPKPAFLPPSNTITKKGKRSSKKVRVVIEILLPTTMSLLLVSAFIGCYLLKRKPNAQKNVNYGNKVVRNPESLQMNFETIRAATGNFSNVNKLSQGKGWNSHKKWIVIVVILLIVLIPLAALGLWLSGKRKKTIHKEARNNVQITCVDSLQYDYITIQDATNSFSNAKRLGKGSLTKVYKGKLPNNEQEIAVKQLTIDGRHSELEFNNELWLLADLQHRNLVKLLGFCIKKNSRLLIYEYLPNESLDWFLYDSIKRAHLNWETRYKIILGIARGLLYLHEDSQVTVIHRDLKPSNILLDLAMTPKISNFSKASLVHAHQSRGDNTTVLGTYGYMPPEYVKLGHFSVKSDVFSFGILLLEIISGKLISKFSDEGRGESLPSYAWRKWVEGKAVEVMDQLLPQLEGEMSQILKCIKIALLCVQENPMSRPNMSTIVFMLNSNLASSIVEPSRPAFIIFSDMYQPSSSSSSQKDKSYEASVNEASISYLDPR